MKGGSITKLYQTLRSDYDLEHGRGRRGEDEDKGPAGDTNATAKQNDSLELLQHDALNQARKCRQQGLTIVWNGAKPGEALGTMIQGQRFTQMGGRIVGVLDPKCDDERKRYVGQTAWQLPALNKERLILWAEAMAKLMDNGKYFAVMFEGKRPGNRDIIAKVVRKSGWNFKIIHLVYDTQLMHQAGFFKRRRGFANAGAAEALFVCWKGRCPEVIKTKREYVDIGSDMFLDVIRQVPVLLPQEFVVVEKVEKDETLHDVREPLEEFGDQADDIGSSVVKDDDDKQHASQGKRMRKYTKR